MLKIILVECLNVKLIGFINFPLLFEKKNLFKDRFSIIIIQKRYKGIIVSFTRNQDFCSMRNFQLTQHISSILKIILPDSYIKPYITGGIGKYNLKHSKSIDLYYDAFDQGMLFNYGVGLEFFIQEISVAVDIRHFVATGDSRNEMVASAGFIFRLPEWD